MDLKLKSRRALKIKPFQTQEYHFITDENSEDLDKIALKSTNVTTTTALQNYQIKQIPKEKRRDIESKDYFKTHSELY